MTSRIEADIKQTRPFARIEQEALVSLLRTAAVVEHALNETLRPFGVTGTQYNVLRILRGSSETGLCGREIGERLISRVPDVPRLLERMEAAGLISRERDPDDRRHVSARITAAGAQLLVDVEPTLVEMERQAFFEVDREDLRVFLTVLDAARSR